MVFGSKKWENGYDVVAGSGGGEWGVFPMKKDV